MLPLRIQVQRNSAYSLIVWFSENKNMNTWVNAQCIANFMQMQGISLMGVKEKKVEQDTPIQKGLDSWQLKGDQRGIIPSVAATWEGGGAEGSSGPQYFGKQ